MAVMAPGTAVVAIVVPAVLALVVAITVSGTAVVAIVVVAVLAISVAIAAVVTVIRRGGQRHAKGEHAARNQHGDAFEPRLRTLALDVHRLPPFKGRLPE
ncbi:MAG: hypothetical protein OER43_14430 [Gammaproteobacteria bacterium]|nr:hypothetical protein [Gammaproteobacteria bacterium]